MSVSADTLRIAPLHEMFGARIEGLDISRPLPETTLAAIRDAFETYSVLLFPEQRLDDASQVAFSELFGPLEKAISRKSAGGPGLHISHLTNVDDAGAIVPPDERKQLFNAANWFWHTDSTYKPQTALASLLFAIEVPASGNETEYASTRAGLASLPAGLRSRVEGRSAMHDFRRSRDMVAPGLVDAELQKALPPVERPLVRENPANGERSLYIASHADYITGMSREESRPILDELLDWCTRPECVYTHHWSVGDLVMWDNRCTLHRGRPWKSEAERRTMSRTTVIDTGYDSEPRVAVG